MKQKKEEGKEKRGLSKIDKEGKEEKKENEEEGEGILAPDHRIGRLPPYVFAAVCVSRLVVFAFPSYNCLVFFVFLALFNSSFYHVHFSFPVLIITLSFPGYVRTLNRTILASIPATKETRPCAESAGRNSPAHKATRRRM